MKDKTIEMLDEGRERMFMHTNHFGMKSAVIFMRDVYEILTAHKRDK